MQRIRTIIWRFLSPLFLSTRDVLLDLKIIRHKGRQEYHVGWLRPDRAIRDFEKHLIKIGFGNHAAAWIDEDEILALRKLDSFRYQYHIRLYRDGEVKGHYEVTPEAGVWNHFLEWEMEPRREDFLKFVGEWITEPKPLRV